MHSSAKSRQVLHAFKEVIERAKCPRIEKFKDDWALDEAERADVEATITKLMKEKISKMILEKGGYAIKESDKSFYDSLVYLVLNLQLYHHTKMSLHMSKTSNMKHLQRILQYKCYKMYLEQYRLT